MSRARTIAIFKQCVETLYMVKDQFPSVTKTAVTTILPQWVQAFHQLLSLEIQPTDIPIRYEAFKVSLACLSLLLTLTLPSVRTC